MTDQSNPYTAPEALLVPDGLEISTESPAPIYSPLQVRLASFIGGPYAAVYTIYQNFKQLGDARGMQLTLYIGIAFNVILFVLLPVIPEKFPKQLIPLIYSWAAGWVASSKQLTKDQINESPKYHRRSGWNVTAVILISIIAFCLITFPLLFLLNNFGVIHIA